MSFDFDFNLDELYELFGGNSDGETIDLMHEETEREIERTRKRLAAEYKQAEKEMKKKADEYLKEFKRKDNEKQKLVKQGKLSVDEYGKWRQGAILRNQRYDQMVDVLAQHMVNADKQARDIVHHRAFGVYANNYNYAKYEVEKGLKINTSFTLFDQKTVERLASKNPKLLPDPSEKTKEQIREKKIAKWSKRKINNAISQGVLQGEPIDQIARRLENVTRMGWNNAVRNARTAMTGAQNGGRLDSYKDSKGLGIKLKKQWMATLDERTRTSHQNLDGELAEVEKKFSNGLMFPADPEGKPAEVYNCRCTMVAELEDYPSGKFERLDNIDKTPIENVTYKQWAAAKTPTQKSSARGVVHTANADDYDKLKKYAEKSGIEHREVKEMQPITHEEIVSKLAGGDMTTGSCASLAFAYCANYHGLDVTDFRGGKSQSMFSMMTNIDKMFKMTNANVMKYEVEREAKDAAKILAGLDKDKLYYLTTGQHAAIVKNDSVHGLQYLEMQSSRDNGFMPFQTGGRSVEETLRQRFGCRKTIHRINLGGGQKMTLKKHVYLVDVDSMQMTEEFKDMMGYINTAKDKQKKGVYGGRK